MKTLITLIICVMIFNSCGLKDDIHKKDSPTSGKLTLLFDEGITLHIKNQIYTFTTTYKNSDITLIPSDEKACIEALFNDSCKIIAITRELTAKEMAQFVAKNIHPETSTVAYDAIALLVNKAFPDSVISVEQLVELLKGNDSTFIKGKHIHIAFDNANSGSTRWLKDSLVPYQSFGTNCFALNDTKELTNNLGMSPSTIGICDYAWLSDKDDNVSKAILKTNKILAVSRPNNKLAYMPDQSNIATRDYPFIKTICIIRRSSEFSLGKGIETFIAGPIGQLMFLKQGLAPYRQEERLIEVDMSPLK